MVAHTASDFTVAHLLEDERADTDRAVIAYLDRPRGTIVVSPRLYECLVAAGLAEPLRPVLRIEMTSDVEQNGRGEEGLHDGCALAGGGSEEPAASLACPGCDGSGTVFDYGGPFDCAFCTGEG